MKKLVIALICIMALLTGCKPEQTDVGIPVNTDTITEKPKEDTKKEYEYAQDSLTGTSNNEYDSKISIGDVAVEKPYEYVGKVVTNTKKPTDTVIETTTPEVPVETGTIIESTPPLETPAITGETPEIPSETPAIPSETPAIPSETLKAANVIYSSMVSDIYFSGLLVIKEVRTVEEFNKDHVISLDTAIKRLKSNLENIEYCDTLIINNFSTDEIVNSNWKIAKEGLVNLRTKLLNIKTGEEFIEDKIITEPEVESALEKLGNKLSLLVY